MQHIYGLAPFFHNYLINSLSQSNYIVASLDESLNEVTQKGETGLCIGTLRQARF